MRHTGDADLPPEVVPLRVRDNGFRGGTVIRSLQRRQVLQNTAGCKRGWGLSVQGTMPSAMVVVKTLSWRVADALGEPTAANRAGDAHKSRR